MCQVPGRQLPAHSTVSTSSIFEITGVSTDSSYWVLKVLIDIAPDGRGWALAAYVKAENADNVLVIEAP